MQNEKFQVALAENEDWEIRQELAQSKNLCQAAQDILAEDEDSDVLAALVSNPTISKETQLSLAQNENLSAEAFAQLAQSRDPDVLEALAENEEIDDEALNLLAANPKANEDTLVQIASNENIDQDTQIKLANSHYVSVLQALIDNDEADWSWEYVAKNPNADEDILLALTDKDDDTKVALLTRKNLPESVQEELSRDSDWDIRAKLAAYSDLCEEVLHSLVADHCVDVLEALFNAQFKRMSDEMKVVLAKNTQISDEIYLALARTPSEEVLEALTHNLALIVGAGSWANVSENNKNVRKWIPVGASIVTLFPLFPSVFPNPFLGNNNHLKDLVWREIAKNPAVSEEIQRTMLSDDDEDLVAEMFNSPQVSDDLLLEFAEDEDCSEHLQCLLATHKKADIRIALAENESICYEAQEILAEDDNLDVRMALASNENVDEEILENL